MSKIKIDLLIWPPLLIYTLYLLSRLAWFDSLATFASDSVHYLAMARHYSPWVNESAAISSAWPLQDFPPFFPWLLALSGAAHSLLYAHLLVTGIGLASLYVLYQLSRRWLDNEAVAIFPVIIFALSPGFILGLQGILSESLYLFLTLIFIWFYFQTEEKSRYQIIIAVLLITSILLTRTIGIAICLALLAHASIISISKRKIQFQSYFVALFPLALYFLSMAIWGPEKESHYLDILIPYLFGDGVSATGTGFTYKFSFSSHLYTMLSFWKSFWIIFWADGISLSYIAITSLLIASLSGLVIRLLKNQYDAWYALFYILILFIWPLSGQMLRLLFPVMPLLLIYAAYAIMQLPKLIGIQRQNQVAAATFFLFILAAILPTHVFIHARADMAAERQMIPVNEIFHQADPGMATRSLLLQNQMFKDFKKIAETALPNEKVMYFMPSYLAVLSNRVGVRVPSPVDEKEYRNIASEKHAKYIFLTRLHPRNSSPNYSGFHGWEPLNDWAKITWCSQLKEGDIATCLFTIESQASTDGRS